MHQAGHNLTPTGRFAGQAGGEERLARGQHVTAHGVPQARRLWCDRLDRRAWRGEHQPGRHTE